MATTSAQGIRRGEAPPHVAALGLAPLGVPLEIELLGTGPVGALAEACAGWRGIAEPGARTLKLRLTVDEALAGTGHAEIAFAGARLLLRGPGVDGWSEPLSGRAECRLSEAYLHAPERLRADVLEPLGLYLLALNGRAPVHAAGFLAGDRVIMLAGPSGAGKSSLARAADEAGFQVLSEDTIHVQLGTRPKVWGWPGAVHLLPADVPDRAIHPVRLRNGRIKHAVPLRCATTQALNGDPGALCILRRGTQVALERLSQQAALDRLARLEDGFNRVAAAVHEAHGALTNRGAWQLTLSDDPAEAIRFLVANMAWLSETAAP